MKSIIIFNLLVIKTIIPHVNAHENHDHRIYNWTDSKDKNIKTDIIFNDTKLEDKINKTTTKPKSIWTKIFRR